MEPSGALKRHFSSTECWVWKGAADIDVDGGLQDGDDRNDSDQNDEKHASNKRSRTVVTYTPRHKVHPLWSWRESWHDHLRLPLWPSNGGGNSRETQLLGFWSALCLRPEISGVELWHGTHCRIRLTCWQTYVLVLDLLRGPFGPPGPGSFRFSSLLELSQQHLRLGGLAEAISRDPERWQVLVTWRDQRPSELLPWWGWQ